MIRWTSRTDKATFFLGSTAKIVPIKEWAFGSGRGAHENHMVGQ